MSGFAEGLIGAVTGGFAGLKENADTEIKAQALTLEATRKQALETLKAGYENMTKNQLADKRAAVDKGIAQERNETQIKAANIAADAKRYGDDRQFLKQGGKGGSGSAGGGDGGVDSPETARYTNDARGTVWKLVESMTGQKPVSTLEAPVSPAMQQEYQNRASKATRHASNAMAMVGSWLPQLRQNGVTADEAGALAWDLATGQLKYTVAPATGGRFTRVVTSSNGAKLLLDPAGGYKPTANEQAELATQFPNLYRDNSMRR